MRFKDFIKSLNEEDYTEVELLVNKLDAGSLSNKTFNTRVWRAATLKQYLKLKIAFAIHKGKERKLDEN